MKEIEGNLWDYAADNRVVVTTNGTVKLNGQCVMGRGVARDAAKKFPDLPKQLGGLIKEHGNHVYLLPHGLISFPVKHNWWELADLELIRRSADELATLWARELQMPVFLPRPGCGNGGLTWDKVRPVIAAHLSSDQFTVVWKP